MSNSSAIWTARRRLLAWGIGLILPLALAGLARAVEPIKIAVNSTSFAWLPLYVADGAGLLEKEGLKLEIILLKDTMAVASAMTSGEIDLGGVGGNTIFSARKANQPLRLLVPLSTEYTSTIFGRKEIIEQAGITANSTLEEKVAAMKGRKLGVVAFGNAQHNVLRFLFNKYGGGLDVDKAAEVVPVGDASTTMAAMRRGVIDFTAFSPPVPEKAVADGYAAVLIDTIGGDVPDTRGMVFTAVSVPEKSLADPAKAKKIAAFVRAMDAANTLIQTDLAAASKAAIKHMSSMDPELFNLGMRSAQRASPKTPEVSVEGLKKYYALLAAGGTTYAQGDFDFEASVANDFVREAVAGRK